MQEIATSQNPEDEWGSALRCHSSSGFCMQLGIGSVQGFQGIFGIGSYTIFTKFTDK
jgi:hypothetical protein